MMNTRQLVSVSVLIILIFITGMLGYHFIEGWDFADSFYMTIITLTTTGFKEVHHLSERGRFFTAFLLLVGVGTFAYGVTTIFSAVMSINFTKQRRRKMEVQLSKLSGHTIVCGYGRMGSVICRELRKANKKFVVIENTPEQIERLEDTKYDWLQGDAADDETLVKAGVKNASVVISTVGNDHDALYLALAARSLNADVMLIVRASSKSAVKKIKLAGADKVILPAVMSGVRVADAVINPTGEDIFDMTGDDIDSDNEHRYRICELSIEADSKLKDKSLRQVTLKQDGLLVLGVKKADETFMFAPDADYQFQEGDTLLAFGTVANYERVKQVMLA